MHIILENQIGMNVEAYIDDIVVKSKKHVDLLDDLKETFDNLRKYKMMLNPNECIFGMSSGKLLNYMVSSRGIDATAEDTKRNTEASRHDGSTQPIHIQARRAWYDVLQVVAKGR
jgi:hypothetical protein